MPANIKTFTNVRVRLRRSNDEKWLTGWVTHLARDEARLRLWSYVPFAPAERVEGECFGQGTVARFGGKILAQAGPDLAISLVGSISYAPSGETPRIYAGGLRGRLDAPEGAVAIQVLDVSPLSLGVSSDRSFTTGQELGLELPTEMGPVAARVSVANCRADPDKEGHFRLGLNIAEMPRLDRARWGRLVVEKAEA